MTEIESQIANNIPPIPVIAPYERCDEIYIEDLGNIHTSKQYAFFKRVFDIVFSVIALIILALPMLIISLVIKSTSKGSVFYRQERLGLNGKKFDIIKFRTMDMDAEKDGCRWSDGDDDPRITTVGKFLRKSRLDELPQFWCILKGEMSVIGPRPERECFYIEFEEYIHGFNQRLKVKPGLTGLAQVKGGYYLRPEEKIIYDVDYIKNRSIWLELRILFCTIKVLFKFEGAK
ncbi:MAG: sugar transferase [Ruminococcaceae bacterium]|nr:sugar transferase [Oscillospiraceae bacterium]